MRAEDIRYRYGGYCVINGRFYLTDGLSIREVRYYVYHSDVVQPHLGSPQVVLLARSPESSADVSTRYSGGGSVMVWAAFSQRGKTDLVTLEGLHDSREHTTILSNHVLPFADRLYRKYFVFQQDDAAFHTSRTTKEFFRHYRINVMEWRALSPDLNHIKNLWGILARRVYAHGREFESRTELIQEIRRCWGEIPPEELRRLVKSMKDRCAKVLRKGGGKTKY